jgi:hypothetical protein
MKITGGTIKTIALLRELEQAGYLIDVYSKSFFERQPSIKDVPNAEYHQEDFEHLLEHYENDPDSEEKPVGHLFFINVSVLRPELKNVLIELYEPFASYLNSGKHNPDFIIVNLFTRQVLCFGLGRRNRIFSFDAVSGKTVNAFGLLGGPNPAEDIEYMDRFIQHDVYDFVSDLAHALYKLGLAMFNYDSKPDQDKLEYTLNSGPNQHGVYQLKSLDGEILDDDEYSKEEIIYFLEQIIVSEKEEDDSMKMINIFFPECYQGDLNTGDY